MAIQQIVKSPDTSNIDLWWEQTFPKVALATRATSLAVYKVTVAYLQALAIENAVKALIIPAFKYPNPQMLQTSFRVTGPVAFKTVVGRGRNVNEAIKSLQKQLPGSAVRHALDSGRNLVTETSVRNKQIVAWRRVTDGHPCYFCAVLASRGAVYRSRESALFSDGDKYHDHCRCHAEALFRDEEEPDYVQKLQAFYKKVTEGYSGSDALNAFRRAWNKREVDTSPISNGAP